MTHFRTSPRLSRRTALGLGLGGVAGLTLGACSNEGRGAPTMGTEEGSGGLQLPMSKPRPEIDGTVLSDIEGVPPAYTTLPYPGFESVPEAPGSGAELSTFTITWGAPPTVESENTWHQAINSALNVKLKPVIVPAQTFGEKLVTTIASGDIPAITTNEPSYRGRAARSYLPQGVFHDLRNFLGGDKVLKYPNLAMVPSYAWENSLIGGALYGVPCYRNQTVGGAIVYRQDWAEKGGFGDPPTNKDELFTWLKAMKKGGGDESYVLATLDQTFNFCGGQVYRVPNEWRLESGTLVKDLETEEYEAALAFAVEIWKAGLVHPNMLQLTPNPAEYQGAFFAGRVAVSNTNLDAYFGPTGQIAQVKDRDKDAEVGVIVPPGADGGTGAVYPDLGYYCMLSIPSSITDEDRIDEILGVIDYLAAPAGSKEYYLTHYGVEDHNYTVEDGVVVRSADPEIQRESFLSMLSSFNVGFYYPGAEDDALQAQKVAEQMTEGFVENPVKTLDSETSFSKGDALSVLVNDCVSGIVTGRRPLSELADMRRRWKENGGEDIRTELEAQL